MKGSAVGDIRVFEELIGKDMFEHVVIVTNMWENPPDEAHKRYEDELAKEQDFFGKIINSGASAGDRYRIMKGSTAGQAQSALLDAFVKRPSKITQIQTEMQKDGAILGNTSAGRAVRNKISSVRKDLEEQLKNLRQYSSELTGEDPIRRNRMNQLIRNLESKLDELSEDEKLLDSNMALIKRWRIWTFAGTAAAAISGECAAVAAAAAMAQAGVVGTEVLFAVGVAGVTVSGLGTLAVAGATVATGATLAYRGIKSFSKWIRDA
ncbi:50S ribosome-binding GTPase, partial [Rhizoctonia solani]